MNPFESALKKAGNYLAGRRVVDNAANPASAYSMQKRAQATAAKGINPQVKAMRKAMTGTQSLIKTGKPTGLK